MADKSITLLAGTAEIIITPPVGVPLVTRPSTGTHDDLFARALVISDTNKRVAIISLDLTGTDFTLADELRIRIRHRTGIDMVLLNSSHTHSAPFTIPYSVTNWNWFLNEGRPWRDALLANITEVVCRADAGLSRAVPRVGRETVQIGLNRRLDLQKQIDVEKRNSSAGVIPWVDVLRIDGMDGKPIAILFSHAAHPVIVHHASDIMSADYPGYAVETVKRHFKGKTIAMFAQACGGDINGEPLNSGFEAAESAGIKLGEAAVRASCESTPLEISNLSTASTTFGIPLCDFPTYEECQKRITEMEVYMSGPNAKSMTEEAMWWSLDAVLCLRDLLDKIRHGERPLLRFEAHALAVNDQWCLLAMPHEIFSEYQCWVENVSPFRKTMVIGYTNACESYIPTDHDLGIGGPEASSFGAPLWYHHRVAPKIGVEQLIKERIKALLLDIKHKIKYNSF